MTYVNKSILWILVGPITSVILGYMAFLFFAFIMGAGFDLDDTGTPTEKFFGRLALPVLGIIILSGSLISLVMSIRCIITHRSLSADASSQ